MTLYQPQLILLKNEQGDYVLHSTTHVPKVNILTNGHSIPASLNSQNILQIELEAIEDQSLPADVNTVTPVVHTVNLGNPFGEGGIEAADGSIEVTFYITDSVTGVRRPGGSSATKNVRAGGHTRPVPTNNQ